MENIIRGYKVADSNGRCRGYQFEVGKRYKHKGKIKICSSGFHFCIKASHCFTYYEFSPNNKVFEVIGYGEHQKEGNDSKVCVGDIEIVRELTWEEVLVACNEGIENTGYSNTGNWNSGNRNSGNNNSGSSNTGHMNSGFYNSGSSNTGHKNSGFYNNGSYNTGHMNSGFYNSGSYNTGNMNSGCYNSGNRNSGDYNSGDYNTGNSNSGHRNSGLYNTGNWNSGAYNSGSNNSGHMNSGNYNSGIFNSNTPPLRMFNKDSDWTWDDYFDSKAYGVLKRLNLMSPCVWVHSDMMTQEEKKMNPNYNVVKGYLRVASLQEKWVKLWNILSDEEKGYFYSLPNFDWDIFTEITSIKKD